MQDEWLQRPGAPFWRRLAAMIYDFLVAVAVYMAAGAVGFFLLAMAVQLGLLKPDTRHLIDYLMATPWLKWLNEIWKLGWVGFFFVYFWHKGGQTLGMRAWRLRLINTATNKAWQRRRLWGRALLSLGGLGTLLVLFHPHRLALQDWLCDTKVIVLSRDENLHAAHGHDSGPAGQ